MDGPLKKHKLEGIGAVSAISVLAAFASNPTTVFLTTGLAGKFLTWILTKFFSAMASAGLVLLNIGAARVETIIDQVGYDGSWDSAEKIIKSIRDSGREMTQEEIKKIDDPVIVAFRKWASFARKKP